MQNISNIYYISPKHIHAVFHLKLFVSYLQYKVYVVFLKHFIIVKSILFNNIVSLVLNISKQKTKIIHRMNDRIKFVTKLLFIIKRRSN